MTTDHKVVFGTTLILSTGLAAISTWKLLKVMAKLRNAEKKDKYETDKILNEYLLFHYGSSSENCQWEKGPLNGLDFPKRCADLCLEYYVKQDNIPNRALDIGCSVGRSTFELSTTFDEVIGIDYSQSFIDACDILKHNSLNYTNQHIGDLHTRHVAEVPSHIPKEKCNFRQGDACNLDTVGLGKFGCVLAANLICRLHTPKKFLKSLDDLVAKGGTLVITSPYTFMPEYTEKKNMIGGFIVDGKEYTGFDGLKDCLSKTFDLIGEKNMPFLIRETTYEYQWAVSHATVWRRK